MTVPTGIPRLYHYPTSGSSQKLRFALAEKGVHWEDHFIDLLQGEQHHESYRRINPKGVVPTLVWGQYVLTEVGPTLELLDSWIAKPVLRPSDPICRYQMRCWIKRIDEVVHPANGLITYTIAGRRALRSLPAKQLEIMLSSMPNIRDRRLRRIAVTQGLEAEEFSEALHVHEALLEDVNDALSTRAYLVGDSISLADITVVPYIKRLEHLGLTPMLCLDRRPDLARWLERISRRPAFVKAISDYMSADQVRALSRAGKRAWVTIESILEI
ncbi:MAG: glutathione S-transferase family protein [Gammaproteobacteria bacterium]|nr:glutathione S-transferase family protein [Gammaproteobacteria bacterium]